MTNYQPQPNDAVLGGRTPPPQSDAVLGGVEGIRRYGAQRWVEVADEQKLAALADAPNQGKSGLELLMGALQDDAQEVHHAAYLLLRDRTEPPIQTALWNYIGRIYAYTIAWWSLNDRANIACDRNGKHPGTIHRATPYTSEQPSGLRQSLAFNGCDSFVKIDSTLDLNLGRRDFSICFWLKTPATASAIMTVLGKEHPLDFAGGWCVFIYQGKLACVLKPEYGGFYERYVLADSNLNDDQWHHLAITVDRNAATGRWYVDGTPIQQPFYLKYPMGLLSNGLPLYIGRAAENPNYFFEGQLGDIRLVKRSLLPHEVRLIYESANLQPDDYAYKLLGTGLRL